MPEVTESKNIRLSSWINFLLTVAGIILIAYICSLAGIRIDLTEDKRYTLSEPTLKVLDGINNDIYIQVFLDGDIPIPLKRLKRSVRETLDEFRLASGRHITYEFINPADTKDADQREAFFMALYNKGLMPVNIRDSDAEGGKTQKMIFPGMIVNYNGIEVPLNFLKNNQSLSSELNILHSMEGLEYELIQTIATVASDTIYKVAFLEGHGELPETEVADITLNLARFYTVDRGSVGGKPEILDQYAAVIVAAPLLQFSEADKFVIDQYIMNGGKILWLLEQVYVNTDSLTYGETVALYHTLNIEDQLFRYGARVNPEIVQDLDCMVIGMSVTTGGEQKQIVPVPWIYYPLLSPDPDHPITRNINKVKGEFVNTVDTVGLDAAVKKTILLSTSEMTKTLSPPTLIRLKEAETAPQETEFKQSGLPVAVLLEGVFTSAFRNRMTAGYTEGRTFKVRDESTETKMIVIADGDIIRNEVQRTGTSETHLPLGLDKLTGQVFGNRDFLLNCVNYLVDDNGLMDLRSRELKLRLLDKSRIRDEKFKWQLVNVVFPVLLVIIAGLFYNFLRKRIYTKY